MMSRKEVEDYRALIPLVEEGERAKIMMLLEYDRVEKCKESFIYFASHMWPGFISGKHHQIMASAFERVA
jgi:hypothetical protein